ncbi:hypothetical protein HDU93_008850 [Gonapodya sp. JEL0774]|nr:hypothetical protein HDU93_008850 [Gonapodya sp. JEL0774]
MPIITLPSGQELNYIEVGPSDAPAVLFLHALFTGAVMWESQISALSGEFRCIAFDARGHGNTPATSPFTTTDIVNDAIALLDHLSIKNAALVGNSQGGWLALEMALKCPERVTAISLISTSVRGQSEQSLIGMKKLAEIWKDQGIEAIKGAFVWTALGDSFTDEKEIAKWLGVADKRGAETRVLAFESAMSRSALENKIGSLQHPVQILHAQEDRSFPVEEAEYSRKALGAAVKDFAIIPNGAHVLPLTNPEGANGYVGGPVSRIMSYAGYRVFGLARSAEKGAELAKFDVIPVIGTLEDNSNRAQHASKILKALDVISKYRSEHMPEADEEMFVVYTSGLAVYGGNDPPGSVVTEETEAKPGPFVAFRPAVEKKILEPLLEHPPNVPFPILGTPDSLRSVAHVQDVAAVYLRAVQRREEVAGQLFNVANRVHERWGEVMDKAAKVMGWQGTFTYISPRTPFEQHRAGGTGVVVNPVRVEKVLGFRQRHAGLLEGIERWYEMWLAGRRGTNGGAKL